MNRRSLSLTALLALATGCPFVPTLDGVTAPDLARGDYALVVTDVRAAPGCSALGFDAAITGLSLGAHLADTAHGDLVFFVEGLPLVATQSGADLRAQGFLSLDAFSADPVPEPMPPVEHQDDAGDSEPGDPGASDGGGTASPPPCAAIPTDDDRPTEPSPECPSPIDPAPAFPAGVLAQLNAEVLAADAFDGSLRASIYAPEAGIDCELLLAVEGVHLGGAGDDPVMPMPGSGGSRPSEGEGEGTIEVLAD